MNLIVCLIVTLCLLTAPGDFAANRLFLLILLFVLGVLHHEIKGRPAYYRITEYCFIGAVFVVWLAGFFSPHYFLLQPIINATLTAHAVSAVVYYWPTETEQKQSATKLLLSVAPWFLVALLAQVKAGDWIPQVRIKEKFLPPIIVPKADTVVISDTTTQAINLFNKLSPHAK